MELTFPPRTQSPAVDPTEAGFDPERLRDAVDYARHHETPPEQIAYDYSNQDPWEGDPAEHAGALGPFPDRRGGQNGVVVRDGAVVAEWGDTTRVDHCFSVAKSFLSVLAGVAYDRGLIENVTDPVADYVDDAASSPTTTARSRGSTSSRVPTSGKGPCSENPTRSTEIDRSVASRTSVTVVE